VEEHLDRPGGWRLAPQLLVEQLAALATPASLVLVPRRQARRLNSQLDFLGEELKVIVHPDDAAAARVVDVEAVAVASAGGVVVGIAKSDASMRRGAVSAAHGHQGANVNLLTDKDDIDRVTGMATAQASP